MTTNYILLGAGGHAKVLLDALESLQDKCIGYCSKDSEVVLPSQYGLERLGDDEAILKHDPSEVRLINGIGSISDPTVRISVFEKFKKKGYQFLSVVHPKALVSKDTKLGEGVQIMAGVAVQPGVVIGDNTIINTGANIDHDCIIEKHAHIAPGVTLSGTVTIKEAAHIGCGATIIQNRQIASHAVIGAGAVVIKDVVEGETVVGNPARVLKRESSSSTATF